MVRTTRGIRRSEQFPKDRAARRTMASANADLRVVVDHLRAGLTPSR